MKRSSALKGGIARSAKRQKLTGAIAEPGSTHQDVKLAVRPDELAWSEVEMPDRLNDFEGFFGLEEVEGVEVIKDHTGKVSFQTTASHTKAGKATSGQADTAEGTHEMDAERGSEEAADLEEWAGFSSDERELEEAIDPSNGVNGSAETKIKKKKQKKTKSREESGCPVVDDKELNPFELLGEEALDQDDDEEEVNVSAWEELGLSAETLSALAKLKFSQPTPIQKSAIPEIMRGHDVIGKASTGSGKTMAFGIPILESFLASPRPSTEKRHPFALIVSPTRELAHQITAHLTNLCSNSSFDGPRIVSVTGGLSVQKQRRQLATCDIVVGTPGRLWEVISTGHGVLDLFKQIRFLVVDEADRLLSEGHFKEMEEIINILDPVGDEQAESSEGVEKDVAPDRQTLVFSATFHKGLQQKLAGKRSKTRDIMSKGESMEYLVKKLRFREELPKFIDVNPTSQMAARLKEGLIECIGTEKDLYLYAVILLNPKKRAIVFTNSIPAVRRITPFLQNLNIPALPLHSQMPQKARLRSVERFTAQPGSVLVATDVAARGLDISDVQLVVHYHLPRTADGYVHRSGRTARAEASGSSVLICAPEEVAGVRRLVAKVHARSESGKAPSKSDYFIRSIDIDRRIVSRLKPRATLAKKLADTVIAKEKKHSENDFLRDAAEDLGVDYDSEELEAEAPGRRGRGSGRRKKEKEAGAMSKAEVQAMRAELKALLSQRVNVGVSERYLTSGGIDVNALLRAEGNVDFLGAVDGLGMDEGL